MKLAAPIAGGLLRYVPIASVAALLLILPGCDVVGGIVPGADIVIAAGGGSQQEPDSQAQPQQAQTPVPGQENAVTDNNAGYNFQYGLHGMPQDYGYAVAAYREAADEGLAVAQCNLAYMYYNGLGVDKDVDQAVLWYQKAAAQGNQTAQQSLRNIGR